MYRLRFLLKLEVKSGTTADQGEKEEFLGKIAKNYSGKSVKGFFIAAQQYSAMPSAVFLKKPPVLT